MASTENTWSPWRIALLSGVVLAVSTLLLRTLFFPYYRYTNPSGEIVWMTVGSFVLLFASIYVYTVYGVLSSLVVVVGSYLYTVYHTYLYFQDLVASGASMSATPTLFYLYLMFWFVPLIAAVGVGGVEYLFRIWIFRPKSST